MKSTRKVERFDYSKIESREDLRYFGLHPISGRIHIDTKRYKNVLDEDGVTDFLPNGLFTNRTTPYFIPAKEHKYDYKFNLFRDLILEFKQEWFDEYKPLFKQIRTPSETYDNARLGGLAFISSSEDIDGVEEDAFFARIRREPKYAHIMQSLYCNFISKLSTEIDRYTLIVLSELGYKSNDFNFNSFVKFSDGLQSNKLGKRISALKKYNAYNLLHKINNFLKHNTVKSYLDLKKWYPDNVCSVEKGTAKIEYENGMFAGDWIILKEGYMDSIFDSLLAFFKDYCIVYLKENTDDADWNYDEYFRNVHSEIIDMRNYWGV